MQLFRRPARLLLALAIVSSLGTSAAPLGAAYRDIIEIEGKDVPLPPGDWLLTGRSLSDSQLVSLSLLRLRGTAADAAVLVQVDRSDAVAWGDPPECSRTDLYYARIRYADDHDVSCAYAAYVDARSGAGAAVDPAWRTTLQRAAQAGWTVPTEWVVSAFRLGDRHDTLEVRYFFAPPGATPQAHLSADGAQALAVWTRTAWDDVARGFRNRRDEAAPAALADFRAGDAPVAEALPADAVPQEAPQAAGASSVLGHIGMKTLTFRVIGTTIDFSMNLLFVGDAALAATMSAVGTVVGPVVFFLHELAWSYADAPVHHMLTLPGIGKEGPDPARTARASAT